MQLIEPGFFDLGMFVILLAALPLEAVRRYRNLKTDLREGRPGARMREYRKTMIEEWLLTAVVAAGWMVLGRTAGTLGLVPEAGILALVGYGLTVLAVVYLLLQSRTILGSPAKMAVVRRQLASASAIIPRNREEGIAFRFLSVTAGICEEFLYRGFLLAYFWGLFPGLPMWVGVVLGAACFGFGHLYQGWGGVVKTGTLGLILGGLYWLTGSIWASILLHSVIDLNAGWLGSRVLAEAGGEPAAEGAA